MYKIAIVLGLVLAFTHAHPQKPIEVSGSDESGIDVDIDIDIDIDIKLEALVKRLEALLDAILNFDPSGIIDIGIDIDIGVDLQELAEFIAAVLAQYHAGNKDALLCLIKIAEQYYITEAADAFIDYLLSFIGLVNTVSEEVGKCNPGGILPNPINIVICLANVTLIYALQVTAATINLAARWAQLVVAIPSALLCIV